MGATCYNLSELYKINIEKLIDEKRDKLRLLGVESNLRHIDINDDIGYGFDECYLESLPFAEDLGFTFKSKGKLKSKEFRVPIGINNIRIDGLEYDNTVIQFSEETAGRRIHIDITGDNDRFNRRTLTIKCNKNIKFVNSNYDLIVEPIDRCRVIVVDTYSSTPVYSSSSDVLLGRNCSITSENMYAIKYVDDIVKYITGNGVAEGTLRITVRSDCFEIKDIIRNKKRYIVVTDDMGVSDFINREDVKKLLRYMVGSGRIITAIKGN